MTAAASSDPAPFRLHGRIALVPSLKLPTKVAAMRQQGKRVPSEAELVAEINKQNMNGGVPATMDRWFRLYTQRHVVGLRPSRNRDAWMIEFLAPMSLSDHERLARGMLRLQAYGGWMYVPVLRDVPPDCQVFDQQINQAWQSLTVPAARTSTAPVRPRHLDSFCDALEEVIEAARQIELATGQQSAPIPYYAVESAGGRRRSTAGAYVFRLAQPARLANGTAVEVRGTPDLMGWVKDQDGDALTVRFTGGVDRLRIPEQGELILSVRARIQQIQRDAVAALRAGRTPNPRLLPLLAGGTLPATMPTASGTTQIQVEPRESLNPRQLTALRRAVAGPDLLLVLGPPGTGKIRTIGEIVRACVARGERVLVTSQTHVAVDNVLERLPDDVRAVRVGGEDRVAQSVQHLRVPALADAARTAILESTASHMQLLTPWHDPTSPTAAWLARLESALVDTQRAEADHAQATVDRGTALAAVEAAHEPARRAAASAVGAATARLNTGQAALDRATAALHRARARQSGLLGFLYRRRARTVSEKVASLGTETQAATVALTSAQQSLAIADEALAAARHNGPAIRQATARIHAAEQFGNHSLTVAGNAAQELHRLLAPHARIPVPGPGLEQLDRFHRACRQVANVLARRAALLTAWRQHVDQADESLHHELVRYADVVGSTCIGVGVQRNLIADQTFDVAIVDEAGQISLPSTVVPLVRARRGVLVGDHHQLPPILNEDVVEWLKNDPARRRDTDPAVLTDLLSTSAFERLYRADGAPHTVVLTEQRRMPATVADFVKDWFYDGQLTTAVNRTPPDDLFASCLALIDTSDLTPKERAERQHPQSENWQAAGYDNPAEARLLIDLVQWALARPDKTWGVIVPYRAQAQYLRTRLANLLGDPQLLKDNLGTVDAFQGGERDIILFGFTRSNRTGRIGFLRELRRLNVAITRARQQLVLVGDFTTLRAANDPRFAALTDALYAHAQCHGDVHPSAQLRTRLRQHHPGGPT